MKCNDKLKVLLHHMNHVHSYDSMVDVKVNNLSKLFNPTFQTLCDCVLFVNREGALDFDDFNKLKKIFHDNTGVEASCNEVRINDYVETEITVYESLSIALSLIDVWISRIKDVDAISKFVFIVGCDSNYTTLRFHKVRSDETPWISDDLEKFNQPVGYIKV